MTKWISLVGLIKQKWIQDGCPHLDLDDLRTRAIEADKELERLEINPAEVFREHRKNNDIAEMNRYIRGYNKYPFYPSYSYKNSKPKVKPSSSCPSLDPDKDDLVGLYHKLKDNHPHHHLPLETELPCELQPHSRDQYRIIMTMILSEETDDYDLSIALGKFFKDQPDMNDLEDLHTWDEAKALLEQYGFRTRGFRGKHNVDRFWSLKEHYYNRWNAAFPPSAIHALAVFGRGYGPKYTRTLRAYWEGERSVLPLDGRALFALHADGFYKYDKNGGRAREDIESKLKTEIPLIDFHELLRFRGQTEGKEHDEKALDRIIVGWNAWRLLCSDKRDNIDYDWVCQFLIKSEITARKLATFFESIRS